MNQLNTTARAILTMRIRVFKPGDSRRQHKVAEMDQVNDLLVALARRSGLRTPADRPAVQAQQAPLFGGG